MQRVSRLLIGLLIAAMSVVGERAQGQETVVISKSRLEELERKEAELERLQRDLRKAVNENEGARRASNKIEKASRDVTGSKPAESHAEQEAMSSPLSRVAPASVAISTLPPLQEGQVVEAAEVMNHYRSEPEAAARRYERGRLRVAGEIVGLDKPLFVRHAIINLKTSERGWRVVCRLEPSGNLPNLFTAKNGEELVGLAPGGARSVLASVGQRVVFEGWCQGLKGQGVTLTGVRLVKVD